MRAPKRDVRANGPQRHCSVGHWGPGNVILGHGAVVFAGVGISLIGWQAIQE